MSTIKHNIYFSLMLLLTFGLFAACENDDTPPAPVIEYVRLIDSEDPVTYANLGEAVAIIGKNLESAKSITFNGQGAHFYSTMATSNSIVTSVPKTTPFDGVTATSELTVETEGGTVSFTFEIAPPAPEVTGFSPEIAGEGAEVSILGNYFYNIESVTFGGNAVAEVLSVTPSAIKVKVPVGYEKGAVEVKSSRSGSGMSTKDFGQGDGDIVTNWNDIMPTNGGWWNNALDAPSAELADLKMPYKYIFATFGNTWWTHDGGINFDQTDQRTGDPMTKAFKFEYANVGDVPWIQVLWKSSHGEYKFVVDDFEATNGEWKTYSIRVSDFTLGDGGPNMTQDVFEADDPALVQFAFVNSGDTDITTTFAMTNVRIVEY